jgi:hypothetical protein
MHTHADARTRLDTKSRAKNAKSSLFSLRLAGEKSYCSLKLFYDFKKKNSNAKKNCGWLHDAILFEVAAREAQTCCGEI